MDERRKAIHEYFETLDKAKKLEPNLRHYSKKSLDTNIIKIYDGDIAVITVEEEDEVQTYIVAQSRLESRMRYRH